MEPGQIVALLAVAAFGTASLICLFVGIFLLLEPDEQELKHARALVEEARRRSAWHAYWVLRSESLPLSGIVSHWKTRPIVRSLILIGIGCLLLGIFAGRFT